MFDVSVHVAPKRYKEQRYIDEHLEADELKYFSADALREILDAVRGLGAHWFNTFANSDVYSNNPEDDELAAFFKAYLDEHPDFHMSSLHYVGSVFELDEDKHRMMLEQMKRTADRFGPCHPRAFVMHPGTFGVGGSKRNIPNYRQACTLLGADAVLEKTASNIRYFGECAANYGVNIAVENIYGGRVYSTIDDLVELVDAVDLPNVGFCLDVGHANCDGVDIPATIKRMGKRLYELHLHDNYGQDSHYPIGVGNINWLDVIRALDEIGYEGTATFEFFRWPVEDKWEGVRQAIATWESLEKIAYEGYWTYNYML